MTGHAHRLKAIIVPQELIVSCEPAFQGISFTRIFSFTVGAFGIRFAKHSQGLTPCTAKVCALVSSLSEALFVRYSHVSLALA